MNPLTPSEVAEALELIVDSDVCLGNELLQSILLIASSNIKSLVELHDLVKWANSENIQVAKYDSWYGTYKGDVRPEGSDNCISYEMTYISALKTAELLISGRN
jgi:hypothetical protein